VQTLNAALPLIPPLETDWPILWRLADRLRELGYTEEGVSRSMGLTDHSVRDWTLWPNHLRRCREQAGQSPCAVLSAFFFLEESLPQDKLKELLTEEAVDCLDRLFLVDQNDDGSMFFRFYLYPLLGSLILTDGHISNRNHLDQVYALGSDSHSLARLAPRPKVASSLDLCTGSGVHAILSAAHAERAIGVDINPRALEFARFNATWNRREVEFLQSDCYQDVPIQGFDLITANPPFVPTPEVISLCRGGGATGEEVTERIIRGLPGMLGAGGIFSMITNVPHFRDESFFQRCQRWLGNGGLGWSMVILSNHYSSPAAYIKGHLAGSPNLQSDFQRWLQSYESVGVVSISNSQVYLFRSPFPWRIDRFFGYPNTGVAPFIESWLQALRGFRSGDQDALYQLHPGLEKVWWMEGRSRIFLEWAPEYRWWQPEGLWLEQPQAGTIERLQANPDGVPGSHLDPAALVALLSQHLVTRKPEV
jgi:hypothetical protein